MNKFLRIYLLFWVILLSGLAGPIVFATSPVLYALYIIGCAIGGLAAGLQAVD